jgi:hypothetical protein
MYRKSAPWIWTRTFGAILLAFLTLTVVMQAQIDTGRITGSIKDSTGALVSRAQITLTGTDTGINQSVSSTSAGTYVFDAVKPGSYSMTVTAAGFGQYRTTNIIVHVQGQDTIDVVLAPGTVTEQVVVNSAAPLIQAEDASLGQTVDTRFVDELPLVGRDWTSLSQLAAGVSTKGDSRSNLFTANGVNYHQNDFRLNGIDDKIEVYGDTASVIPPPDAIDEFKLQTGNYDAEVGHSTGPVINAVVKSGGNELRGTLWEYIRNDAFNANDYFSNLNGAKKSKYRQNTFGGTVGGPVFIPKLYSGKDRTFFFFDYQGIRITTPNSFSDTVPTANMTSSGFTNLEDLITFNSGTRTDALGRVVPVGAILDPATTRQIQPGAIDTVSGLPNPSSQAIWVRDPFDTDGSVLGVKDFTAAPQKLNQLPTSRLDQNAIKLLGLYPAANRPGFWNNYFYKPATNNDTNQIDARVDHRFSASDSLFGVVNWSHNIVSQPGQLPGLAIGQNWSGSFDSPHYAIATSYTHVFTPTLSNEVRFGYDHAIDNNLPPGYNQMGVPAQFGIQGIPQLPMNGGLPMINIGWSLTSIGVAGWEPTIRTVKALEITDNVTKIYGRHSFKTGVQVDRVEGDITQPAYGKGQFDFNGQYTSVVNQTNGLNGIGDILLTPISSNVGGPDNVGGASWMTASNFAATNDYRYYVGAYFQDDWKVSSRLTLNLGLRYDHFTPYSETNERQANFVPADNNAASGKLFLPKGTCNTPMSASFTSLLAKDNISLACTGNSGLGSFQSLNFAPRLGFAYRVTPKFVVRGGYGISYGALDNIGFGPTLGNNYPFLYTVAYGSPDNVHPDVYPNGSIATLENGLAGAQLQDTTLVNGAGLTLVGRQWNFNTPYTQSMNFTLQYLLGKNNSMQAGWVSALGRHLDNQPNNNNPYAIEAPGTDVQATLPFPDFARGGGYFITNGTSNYHSLQTTFQHQFSAGLSLLANYTFSKCLTDQSTNGSSMNYRAPNLPGFGVAADYTLCDNDSTHVVHSAATYELPVGTGKQWLRNSSRIVNALVGGWAANYIFTYQSGQPLTVGCPIQTTADFGCNANLVPGQNPYAGPHNRTQWLNPAAFTNPPVATASQQDVAPLGSRAFQVRGPGFNDIDASAFKQFSITESSYLQFRAEAYNLVNNVQWGNPGNLDFTNTTNFSTINGLRGGPRILQFALKLYY